MLTPETVMWVLPCEVLHGLTFAALWSACCNNAAAIAPPGLKASMQVSYLLTYQAPACSTELLTILTGLQGVVGGVHWGLGVGTGATAGGVLFAQVGGTRMFMVGAVISTVAFAVALAATRAFPAPSSGAGQDEGKKQGGGEEQETHGLLTQEV